MPARGVSREPCRAELVEKADICEVEFEPLHQCEQLCTAVAEWRAGIIADQAEMCLSSTTLQLRKNPIATSAPLPSRSGP